MELETSLLFNINDLNCELRTLEDIDVNQDYINGLNDQKKYIENIPSSVNISNQKKYINDILNNENDTICGLFLNGDLVGTVGVQRSFSEPFLRNLDVQVMELATVGIFIFNKKFRGMGIGKAMVWAATYLFYKCTTVEWFGAGMERGNVPSYKSFLSCVYNKVSNNKKYFKLMAHIKDLKMPNIIKEMSIQNHAVK